MLKHPLVILLAIVVGVGVGIFAKDVAKMLAPIGDLYLFFIQMSVYPILVMPSSRGSARLIKARSAGGNLLRMTIVFVACMSSSCVRPADRSRREPGSDLDEQARQVLGQLINQSDSNVLEVSLSAPADDPVHRQSDFWDFLRMLVHPTSSGPQSGLALQISFSRSIFGIALGNIRSEASTPHQPPAVRPRSLPAAHSRGRCTDCRLPWSA